LYHLEGRAKINSLMGHGQRQDNVQIQTSLASLSTLSPSVFALFDDMFVLFVMYGIKGKGEFGELREF